LEINKKEFKIYKEKYKMIDWNRNIKTIIKINKIKVSNQQIKAKNKHYLLRKY
jgi:hypothetical protein